MTETLERAKTYQQFIGGEGAFEFVLDEVTRQRWVGLTNSTQTRKGDQLAFAWRVRNGTAEVREVGKLRTTVTVGVGNVLRIAIVNGRMEFSKNGVLVYRSGARVTYPLNVHAVLVSSGATVAAPSITKPITAIT